MMVLAHALFILQRKRVIAFAVETHTLYARAPVFVDKIRRGVKPGDIPIEQPTHFGLWINLKTAHALGVMIPPTVLARAERVIE